MAPPTEPVNTPRLQKYLADLGLGSRRELEKWIEAGRVSINGVCAELGQKVAAEDVVRVDGQRIYAARRGRQGLRVIRYHKPAGEVCSRSSDETRPSIFEQLPLLATGRWINVGRLDITTSGLLLLTNNGELAHRLMHPSSQVEREYAVRVRGAVTPAALKRLRAGVELDDGLARFDSITRRGGDGTNQWFHVELREGRSREVRRLWESQSVQVARLIRVRYGPVTLGRALRAGRWEEATRQEIADLLAQVDMKAPESVSRKSPASRSTRARGSRASRR